MIWTSLALLLTFAGLFGLYLQWKSRNKSPVKNFLFWCAIAASSFCWSQLAGIGSGIVYTCAMIGYTALFLVSLNGNYKKQLLIPSKYRQGNSISRVTWLRNMGYVVLAVPFSGFASATASLWVTSPFMNSTASHIVLNLFLVPLVWAVMAYWSCSQHNQFRSFAVLAVTAGLSSVGLYFL